MTDIAFRFSSPAEGDFFCEKQSAANGVFLYRVRMAWRVTRIPALTVLRFSLPGTDAYLKISCDYNDMTSAVEVSFFTELTAPADRYECLLRIDARPVPFTQALTDAKQWFASLGYAPARTPAAAFDPVYSTWYSYLTRVTADDVLRECRTAKQLGMDLVIEIK